MNSEHCGSIHKLKSANIKHGKGKGGHENLPLAQGGIGIDHS